MYSSNYESLTLKLASSRLMFLLRSSSTGRSVLLSVSEAAADDDADVVLPSADSTRPRSPIFGSVISRLFDLPKASFDSSGWGVIFDSSGVSEDAGYAKAESLMTSPAPASSL